MKRDFIIFFGLTLIVLFIWHKALFNFFAQDDFILINQFSQNSFWQNIKNVFGAPTVTHWRPIHNLYFFVTGAIFGKNYLGYHLVTFFFHTGASFLIYKTLQKLTKDFKLALTSAFIYAIQPAHFVSLFWISGGATMIGFFLLIASIYCFLVGKKSLSLILYILSLLASEAMIVGLLLFYCVNALKQRRIFSNCSFLIQIIVISLIFGLVRFFFLTPKAAFDIYHIELSVKIFPAVKYYLSRTTGFAETSGDQIVSWILLGWLILIVIFLMKALRNKGDVRPLILSVIIIIVGLFPFILIPQHLSPHYMNIPIFGFSIMIGLALKQLRPIVSFLFLLIFLGIAIYNINLTISNNWVVKRSNLAKTYLAKIERDKPIPESILIFDDNEISTSDEAYIVLGTGNAIKFFFPDKNYKTCFTKFEVCGGKDSYIVE